MTAALFDAALRAGLTHRQAEVLSAYVTEGSTKAAAEALGMALSTVTGHLSRIQRRLGAKNTAAAVARVLLN